MNEVKIPAPIGNPASAGTTQWIDGYAVTRGHVSTPARKHPATWPASPGHKITSASSKSDSSGACDSVGAGVAVSTPPEECAGLRSNPASLGAGARVAGSEVIVKKVNMQYAVVEEKISRRFCE